MAINPMDYRFVFPLSEKLITADIVRSLAEVAAALDVKHSVSELAEIKPGLTAQSIATLLKQGGKKAAIFMGEYALSHPHAQDIRALVQADR